jgi:hypothetical protein
MAVWMEVLDAVAGLRTKPAPTVEPPRTLTDLDVNSSSDGDRAGTELAGRDAT